MHRIAIDLHDIARANIRTLHWVGPLLLCPTEVDRIPAAVAGVYLLHTFSPAAGGYPLFYAGQTADLRRRLSEHLGAATAKFTIRVVRSAATSYFSAAPVHDRELRLSIEAGLIKMIQPACNNQTPAAQSILTNLPPLKF